MEILVPAGIFIVGILISLSAGKLAVQRIEEGRHVHGEDQMGRTAAYIAPWKDAQHNFPDSMTKK
jgi:hypothetical protein